MAMREARYSSRPRKPVEGTDGGTGCWARQEKARSTMDGNCVKLRSVLNVIGANDHPASHAEMLTRVYPDSGRADKSARHTNIAALGGAPRCAWLNGRGARSHTNLGGSSSGHARFTRHMPS